MGHELRFVLRRIRRRPFHAAVVAATLGLGLGASLAVFAVVDAVLLNPLPWREPDRLVRITQTIPAPGLPELPFSDVGFRRLASDARSIEPAAAWDTRDVNLIGSGAPRRLIVARVTASLFPVLRVDPALGRGFGPEEDRPNGPRVLVLSDRLWRSAFQADPGVIGQPANLEGVPYTVVGVLPPHAAFPSREVAAWEPLQLEPAATNPYQLRYAVIGRLADGATIDQARRDLTQAVRAVGREFPGPHSGSALDPAGYLANVRPLADEVVGDTRPVVVLLLGGVLLLLLLTTANVANLQLAGVIARGEELVVRTALGATKGRLVRGALLEGLVLTAAGATIGLTVAGLAARFMAGLLPAGLPPLDPLPGSGGLLATALAILGIGAMVGAVPVALVARRDAMHETRHRSTGITPARFRRLLAAAQVAFAVLLVHGSGLLIASARAVQEVRLGFRPDSTISIRINLPLATFQDRNAREGVLRRVLAEAGQLPGVTAVGVVNALPLTPGRQDLAMAVEGRPFKADGTDPLADYRVASAGYFAAMGIELTRGRLFTDDDATPQYTPLVISEGLARRLFPNGDDPIGQRLRFGPAAPWMPIIGVVAEAKNRSLTEEPRAELYAPGLGTWSMLAFRTEITLVARARGDAMALATPIRRLIAAAAPDAAVYELNSLGDIVRDARARMTTATRLMSGYAAAALILAMAGTYAVLSYLVAQRRRELAIRMALGAAPRAVVGLVTRESLALLGLGIAAGLAGALAASQLLAGLLYGVQPLDLAVLLGVVLAAALTGAAAAVIPARRATRVDPAAALRAGD